MVARRRWPARSSGSATYGPGRRTGLPVTPSSSCAEVRDVGAVKKILLTCSGELDQGAAMVSCRSPIPDESRICRRRTEGHAVDGIDRADLRRVYPDREVVLGVLDRYPAVRRCVVQVLGRGCGSSIGRRRSEFGAASARHHGRSSAGLFVGESGTRRAAVADSRAVHLGAGIPSLGPGPRSEGARGRSIRFGARVRFELLDVDVQVQEAVDQPEGVLMSARRRKDRTRCDLDELAPYMTTTRRRLGGQPRSWW